jgi:hypothetical protein
MRKRSRSVAAISVAAALGLSAAAQAAPAGPPDFAGTWNRYEVPLSAKTLGYVRGDWSYSSHYDATPPLGVPGYSPDNIAGAVVSKVNVRAGVEFNGFDINAFVDNLTNAKDGNISGGRGGCTAAGGPTCTTYSTYTPFLTTSWGTPRQVGLQIVYRH